ncbi:MAG: DUF4830 domain-containing protein [Clostridia bacterium]|nr:DUF4830 domain-containing protein [Clostridia bacterium]
MFVFSLRGDKLKKAVVTILAAATVFVAIFIFTQNGSRGATPSSKNGMNLKASDAAERIAFLSQFGWQVSEDPLEVSEVIIPYEFDDTYTKYNELQKEDDFDLSDYKGVRVKRWTYEVLNYPSYENSDGIIRANILVYDGHVIGGDVCNIELDGFMQGFSFPGGNTPEESTQPETTQAPKSE